MAETFTPDNLIAGDFPRVGEEVTILTGNNLTRGTVLGKVTASGKCVACDSTAVDGSEDPYAVLLQDTDASAADKVAPAALSGEFAAGQLTYGGTDTDATHKAAMRALCMYIKPVSAGGLSV